jgi:glycosyltransferase involved in cell wall biosynthesis
LEIRDLWPEFAIDMGILRNRWVITAARWTETFFYRQASHIIVNSPAYRDYLVGKRVPDGQISLIPNGVDASMFCPEDRGTEFRQELGLNGSFLATYTGALGPANAIPTILEAAEQLRDCPDVHFLLVGDGKERSNLEQEVRARRLPNVTFTGTFPKHRMRDVLAASDICLATLRNIPMFRTTYPNKVFDYMAAGRPTILAIDGVIKDVVCQAQAGLCVAPEDALGLARAVRELRSEPDKCRRMGQSARSYVVANFDRQTQARALETLLRRLAGR